jgi:hypothetical protein
MDIVSLHSLDDAVLAELRTSLELVGKERVDWIFAANDRAEEEGLVRGAAWQQFLIEEVSSFVLADEESPGVIDASETAYLSGKIDADGVVDFYEIELLLALAERASGTDDDFKQFLLESIEEAARGFKCMGERECSTIERAIFAPGSLLNGKVHEEEARMTFRLQDRTKASLDNCARWPDVFVRIAKAYVLEDDDSPGVIDELEAGFLFHQIRGDGTITPLEHRLLVELAAEANGGLPEQLASLLQS